MKKKYSKAEIWSAFKNTMLVIVGTLVLGFGTSIFLLPFNLVTGGVSGYSIIIKTLLPFEFITKEMVIAILTWLLFILGFIILGKNFAMKSLI